MGPSSLILIISSIWRPKIIELIETVEIMLISIISTVSIISKNLVAQKIELIEIRVSGFQLL